LQAQKGFYGKMNPFLHILKKFFILSQIVILKDNAKLKVQIVKLYSYLVSREDNSQKTEFRSQNEKKKTRL